MSVCMHWASVPSLALASSHSIHLQSGDGVAGRAWVSDPARWCQRHHRAIARAIASAVRMCRSPGRPLCFQPCRALHCRPWAYSLNCSATADYSSSHGFSPFWSGCISAARSFGPALSHFCSAMAASVTSRSQPLSALVAVHFHQMLLLDQSCGELQRAWMPLLQHQPLNACDVELSLFWGLGYRSLWRL